MKKILFRLLVVLSFFSFLPLFSQALSNDNLEIILNIASRKVLLYKNDQVVKEYQVGVGNSLTPTPLGEFKIVRRIYNPAWINPYRQSKIIPAGEKNPIGQYWLGFAMNKKNQEFGFHATNDLNSVGKASTHGCIRLYPNDMKEFYSLVKVDTPVQVIYNPIEVKEFQNKLFVRAHPDIYNYMNDEEYLQFAKNQLSGANLVKEQNLYKAIANKDGKDYFIGWTGAEQLNEQEQGPVEKGRLN